MNAAKFSYDLTALALALRLTTPEQCQECFVDGRALSWIFEPAITSLLSLPSNCRVRILTDGVDVSPSGDRGKGRSFNPITFLPDLLALDRIVVADAWKFPKVEYWVLPAKFFVRLWNDGLISHKTGHLGRTKFLKAVQLYTGQQPG